VERLARYIMRPPISLERMRWSGDGEVFYQPKGGHDGRARQPGDPAETFDPAEFLARVIMHIPEPRRHLVRYYGAYSNVLLAVHRVRQLSPPLREPISAAAAGAGCARSGGIWALDRGSGGAVPGRLSRPPVPADSGEATRCVGTRPGAPERA